MARTAEKTRGRTVALTGATGDLGALLVPELQADPTVHRILLLGPRPPPDLAARGKLEFRRLDLTRGDAEAALDDALGEQTVDALYHLAFRSGPVRDPALAHELEVIGTLHVLAAVARNRVARLILPSLTMLYGAQGPHAAVLPESSPLHGCPSSRFVSDKVQVEKHLAEFRASHPEVHLTTLRFAPLLGPNMNNPATRLLRRARVPTLLGFDPLWQALHEEDAVQALRLALDAPASGTFNVVAPGVLTLSGLIRECGAAPLPLPGPVARSAMRLLKGMGVMSVPIGFLDYFRFSCIADGARARDELGFVPRHDVHAAAASLRGI